MKLESVCYLYRLIKATPLKEAVIDLSVEVWHKYIETQDNIAITWIEKIKQKKQLFLWQQALRG